MSVLSIKLRFSLGIFVLFTGNLVHSQYVDLRSVSEGYCPHGGFPLDRNLSQHWLETTPLRFVNGGSKFQLYRLSASRPQNNYFVPIREHDFHEKSCIQTVFNIPNRRETIYARGQPVQKYSLARPYPYEFGILDATPTHYPGIHNVMRHHITLTDNRNFAVFANCWTGSNIKGWHVVSVTPTLPSHVWDQILYHIEALGFDRRETVVLDHRRCGVAGGPHRPLPGYYPDFGPGHSYVPTYPGGRPDPFRPNYHTSRPVQFGGPTGNYGNPNYGSYPPGSHRPDNFGSYPPGPHRPDNFGNYPGSHRPDNFGNYPGSHRPDNFGSYPPGPHRPDNFGNYPGSHRPDNFGSYPPGPHRPDNFGNYPGSHRPDHYSSYPGSTPNRFSSYPGPRTDHFVSTPRPHYK